MRRVYAARAGNAAGGCCFQMLKATTCQEINDESVPTLEGGVDQSLDFLCDYYENMCEPCDQLA